MPREFDYRSTWPYPTDEVYATMTDPEYLRARLARIGGPGAALLEHHSDADGVRYRLRHGLDAQDMPAAIRTVMPGNITIERAESWKKQGPGRYDATVAVTIHNTPASAAGGMQLHDANPGSELILRLDISVKVPLIGGRIEDVVVGRIGELFDLETQFTREWLEQRQ
jgi:hypothetical protein